MLCELLFYPESKFPYIRDGNVQYTLDVPERFLLNFLYTVLDVPGKYDKSCLVPASLEHRQTLQGSVTWAVSLE